MKGVIYLEKIIASIINNDISLIFMTIIFIAGIICGIYRYIIYEKELKNAECNNKSEKGLTEKILSEGESAVKDYRKFLSAGCSVPPIDALKLAGIDMSSPEPLRKAMKVFICHAGWQIHLC